LIPEMSGNTTQNRRKKMEYFWNYVQNSV
jgi:hypothetical protein